MNIDYISQIAASDIIGWLLAFLGGFIAYRIVDNLQTSLERHSVISDIETKINELFSSDIARKKTSSEELEAVMVRTVLHDETLWLDYDKDKTQTVILNTQRYVNIRNDEKFTEYISTQALHESLILFRRLEKLHKARIIKDIDLADLWREILPFSLSNRIGFLKTYYSERDVESLLYIMMHTYLACEKYKMDNATDYFKSKYKIEQVNLMKLLENNKRFRFADKLHLRKFKSFNMSK